jgi:hypothetical protein
VVHARAAIGVEQLALGRGVADQPLALARMGGAVETVGGIFLDHGATSRGGEAEMSR